MTARLRVAVVGATGYSGAELVRYLAQHPMVALAGLYAVPRSPGGMVESAGVPFCELCPQFRGQVSLPHEAFDLESVRKGGIQAVFLATPAEVSLELVPQLRAMGVRVIDLSGAFRLVRSEAYPEWYGFTHTADELLSQSVYGLVELRRAAIAGAGLVANPGCYATAAALGLAPVLGGGRVATGGVVIVDAKSGVSGAGRAPSRTTHFCEAHEDLHAYGVLSHRHTPEIQQTLALERLIFTPHLAPMNRGIFATCYVPLCPGVPPREVTGWFADRFQGEPFIRLSGNTLPAVRHVQGSNYADIGWRLDERTATLIVCVAIDNLGKGAAGQAVQNLNCMFGFAETSGLKI